jgi:lipopolysaccharide/colanic/teichoic acid biosynthesis glycosyltransferase
MSVSHGSSSATHPHVQPDGAIRWTARPRAAHPVALRRDTVTSHAAIDNVATVRDWHDVLASLQAESTAPRVAPLWRAVECLVALSLLILTLPIMLVVAAIVWCDSPGPVLFRHVRVGVRGRLFAFTKFRTLYADARERWPELYAYQYSPDEVESLHFKIHNDPRVTRVGRWLRKSTLDELPNLWHVLTGDMSLVGPRPEIPEMLVYYDARGLKKFSVRPGVTGLAQVSGRGNLSFHETVHCDVDYVERRSLWLDLRILIATLLRTVQREGAF